MIFTFSLPVILLVVFGEVFHGTIGSTGVAFRQYFTAGIIASGIMSATFVNVGASVASDRADGTLTRLAGTPMPPAAYFAGKAIAALAVAATEAGLLLADLLTFAVPRGFFPPVTPGTKFVTIGGMIAADVHGKNHHTAGTFGAHVESLSLLTASGEILRCARDENAELFAACRGGMGLLGIILDATFRLIAIETSMIRQETRRAADLTETVAKDVVKPTVDAAAPVVHTAIWGIGTVLTAAIVARLFNPAAGARQLVGSTAARSRDSLLQSRAALDRALDIARRETDQELLAIEVRDALDELGKIAGAVYTDDILDRIFSRFCIGK